MEENQDIKYQISPNFNFLYELGMPTGRKIRNTLTIFIVFIIATFALFNFGSKLSFENWNVVNNIQVINILNWLCIIADIFVFVKLAFHIIFQSIQYAHISYTFYDDYMVYEDDFLNQHKKNIKYRNIKEIEIRRTIWDRILNYGVIVVYTNADNVNNNGLVIYGIKNPKENYERIDKLVHLEEEKYENGKNESSDNSSNDSPNVSKSEEIEEKDFVDSLKNINK